jgi:hypothetical protein
MKGLKAHLGPIWAEAAIAGAFPRLLMKHPQHVSEQKDQQDGA